MGQKITIHVCIMPTLPLITTYLKDLCFMLSTIINLAVLQDKSSFDRNYSCF